MSNKNFRLHDKSNDKDDGEKIEYKPTGFQAAFPTTEVKEQQPRFSSVKIHHPTTEMGVRDFRLSSSLPNSLETLYKKPLSKETETVRRNDFTTKDRQKNLKSNKWMVDESCLEFLTEGFPLERTSKLISDVDASDVALRICDCLRERSVQATYKNKKATAKCITVENVKFRIQLFSNEGGGIMVEVQRRRGDGVLFMRECRAILNAAAGAGNVLEEPTSLGSMSDLKCIKNVTHTNVSDAQSEVARVEQMLLDRKEETSHHALVLLRDMTDPVKSSAAIVEATCKRIFDKTGATCRHLLARLESSALDLNEKSEDGQSWLIFQHQLVLNIMSNALSVMHELDQLTRICQDRSMQETVTPILLKLVTVGRAYPHISCLAIKCISSLASIYAIRLDLLEADVISSLRDAADIGVETHESLERLAESTLLQCSH